MITIVILLDLYVGRVFILCKNQYGQETHLMKKWLRDHLPNTMGNSKAPLNNVEHTNYSGKETVQDRYHSSVVNIMNN